MRAIAYDEQGGPEVLHLTETAEPHAAAGQVRIRVHATTVNPWDTKVRSGAMGPGDLPAVPGIEAAGVVDEVGDGVTDVAIGDRVVGPGSRTTAELAVLDAWAAVPDGLPVTDVVALPVAVEASARLLRLLAVPDGATVLVDGAGGGVGTTLVQLAVARGLTVIGTTAPDALDALTGLGALATPYGEGLPDRVAALTAAPVSAAYDLSGRGVEELIAITGDPGRVASLVAFDAADRGILLSDGSEGRAWDALPEAVRLLAAGDLRVVVDRVLPWTAAADAHAYCESGQARGKIVVTVGSDS